MSKFCRNCGTELSDEAVFCKNCGTNTTAEAVVAETPAEPKAEEQTCDCAECGSECAQQEAPAPVEKKADVAGAVNGFVNKLKNKDKNALMIAAGAVLGLVLIVVLLVVLLSGGPEDAFDNYFEASFECNSGAVEDLAPEAYWEFLDEEKGIEIEDLEEFLDDDDYKDKIMDSFEALVGKDVSFSYDIIETDDVSEKDLDAIKDYLKKTYDIAKKDVGEAFEIEAEVLIEGDDDEEEVEKTIFAVEIDGDWYPCMKNGKLLVDELVSAYLAMESLKDLGDDLGGLGNLDNLGGLGDMGDLSDILG